MNTVRYGAAVACWPPSLVLDQEEDEKEINKSDLDHILCKRFLSAEIQTHTSFYDILLC